VLTRGELLVILDLQHAVDQVAAFPNVTLLDGAYGVAHVQRATRDDTAHDGLAHVSRAYGVNVHDRFSSLGWPELTSAAVGNPADRHTATLR
jgi:hypothetical protein